MRNATATLPGRYSLPSLEEGRIRPHCQKIPSMASFVAAFANPFNYLGGVSFNPEKDIHDLSGKVALVTGGTLRLKYFKYALNHQEAENLRTNILTGSRQCWSRQRNNPTTFKT